MAIRTARVEFAALDYTQERELQQRSTKDGRLPPAHAGDIEDLWQDMPGEVGLASSLAGQIETMRAFSRVVGCEHPGCDKPAAARRRCAAHGGRRPRAKKPRKAKGAATSSPTTDALLAHIETPEERLQRLAAEAAAHFPAVLPPEELPEVQVERPRRAGGTRYWNRRDGLHDDERPGDVRAARGCGEQRIHTHASASGNTRRVAVGGHGRDAHELVEAPLLLEGYVDWSPRAAKRYHRRRDTRAALQALECDGDLVAALYAKHGGANPDRGPAGGGAWEFPDLGDLSPLAIHTAEVARHAAAMTRRQNTRDGVTHLDWRESVSLRAAAHDLLDSRGSDGPERAAKRIEDRNEVRRQCESLLQRAGRAYLAARGGA